MNKAISAQQAKTTGVLPPPQGVLQRKCACGNRTVAGGECAECTKKKRGLQRKLAIGASNDPLELEADRVADQVMAAPGQSATSRAPLQIQRHAGQVARGAEASPASVDRVLAGSGRPLEPALRRDMEHHFGYDFSQVRVHSDAVAEQSARDVNANAYTVGHNVVFGLGRFVPGSHEGRRLLAHELAHVVQQSGSDVIRADQSNEKRVLPPTTHTRSLAENRVTQSINMAAINIPVLQRQRRGAPAHPHRATPTPTLGPCRPVQDDLRPTAPWSDLQRGYQARCSTAATDVAGQVGRAVDDILQGRIPHAPHLPDQRSSVDCACAYGTPRQAALAALPVLAAAGPLAARLYLHFLGASGTPMTIDVADMIARSAGVRQKIFQSIAHGGMTGTTRLEQSDYHDRDLQFAYGAIDCVQWRALPPARRSWRSDPTTQVRVSMLDYYEFHPGRLGVSQCAHAACVELVARGQARNFWTRGDEVVSWNQLR
ncbi:MAG: eCIS core domain-containing protein [Methylobacter sp.]